MSLTMVQGDTRRFLLTFTMPGTPGQPLVTVPLAGSSITWTAKNQAGAVVFAHSIADGHIVLQPQIGVNVAYLTIDAADTASLTGTQNILSYRTEFVDALGNPSTAESGTLLVTT